MQLSNKDEGKWALPESLRLDTPDKLAAADQVQKELATRSVSPFARLSPAEDARIHAAKRIEHLKDDLARVNQTLTSATLVDGNDSPALAGLKEARFALASRLAEQYTVLGRFDLAFICDPRPAHRKEHLEILEAIKRDNAEFCECGPGRDFVKRDIPMLDGTMRVLRACNGCGSLNVVAIPSHLAQQRAHRSKARAMVDGLSPDEAAKELRAANHTSEKLLK